MKKNDKSRKKLRTKNWILFALLLGLIALLYALSFVKFGQTVATIS